MPKHIRKYPWPASKIDRDVMHELHMVSRQTGQPITAIIRDAIHQAMNARMEMTPPEPIGFVSQPPRPAA
jgi:hypothetical protein